MVRPLAKAGFVFLFMAFLAAEAGTGFMRDLFRGGVYPRAMLAFDWILETLFVGPLGSTGGAALLLGLGVIFAGLILRQGRRKQVA